MDIPKRVRPILPSRIVRDGLFQGAHDSNLSRQTAAYVTRCCGNRAHYAFHSRWYAPKATVAAGNTWYDFKYADGVVWDVPWHHQTQHSEIRCRLRLITTARFFPTARLQSDDLVDAVAATTGVGKLGIPFETSTFVHWNSQVRDYTYGDRIYPGDVNKVATYELKLESPAVPANRRIAVWPQVKMSSAADIFLGLSDNQVVWLESMSLIDMPDPDTGA